MTMGEDGVVLYCNSRFAKMLLAPLEKVMGNPLRRWVSERSQPALDQLLRQAITGDRRRPRSRCSTPAAGGSGLSLLGQQHPTTGRECFAWWPPT